MFVCVVLVLLIVASCVECMSANVVVLYYCDCIVAEFLVFVFVCVLCVCLCAYVIVALAFVVGFLLFVFVCVVFVHCSYLSSVFTMCLRCCFIALV